MDISSIADEQDLGGTRSRRLYDVTQSVVRDFAPEELPLLSSMRDLDDIEIGRRLAGRTRRDDPLGFGLGEIVVLASPIIWGVVQSVVDRIAGSATDSLMNRIRGRWRRKRVRAELLARLPEFNHDQLLQVRHAVIQQATKGGMKQARAEQLAAAVVDQLMFDGEYDTGS